MQLKAATEASQERRVSRNKYVMTIGEAMVMVKQWNCDTFILMVYGLGVSSGLGRTGGVSGSSNMNH